jgi:hypothetical protein
MSWIKMRIDLVTHPKVVRIASAICPQSVRDVSNKFLAIGGLLAVWGVFDTHSVDGVMVGYTPEALDGVIGLDGISRAMMSVGWLLFDGDETLTLPEFDTHNGQSAKRRAEDQKRKKDGRKSASRPQSVRNLSANEEDESPKNCGPDKREIREEIYTHTPHASDAAKVAMVMRKFSIGATPHNPTVVAMAEQGVDLQMLEDACREAREAKPNESISVGYVVKKLEGWKAQAKSVDVSGAKKPRADSWFLTPQAMSAKARELGIADARPGESEAQFKARIQSAMSQRETA